MRSRSLLLVFIFMVLSAGCVGGWVWAWREHRQVAQTDFQQKRLALLEAENRRLARVIADRQRLAERVADQERRKEIERTVADLRGLSFLRPVIYREIPRADLPGILRQKLAQQVPDQEFGNTSVSLAALGLLPPGLDLKQTYLNLLGEQVGAFYDQHSAELFTFSGQGLDNGQNRVILAHELTHALEDQHFQLARLPLEAKGNDDRAMAASALVEGDATLVMSRYMLDDLSASALKDALAGAFTTDVRQLAGAPRYLRETLLFPYLRGQEFCTALYQQGGWAALAEAFRHPPESTAQILHPERFLAHRGEAPTVVDFPRTALLGQEPVGDNVLGEFGVRQFLAKWLKDDAAASGVAAGWTADRYLVYGNATASSYVWKSIWSTAAAADRFAEAALRSWCVRFGLKSQGFTTDRTGSERIAVSPGGHRLMVLIQQSKVTLIDAQDRRWETAIRGLLDAEPKTTSSHDAPSN